ncbi:MAG: hypothetical protein M1816_005519 [Peltula sp. TS41687]|nr:MAG: hypothetical protein M1816_005519 [Peltula sp. TS41687]
MLSSLLRPTSHRSHTDYAPLDAQAARSRRRSRLADRRSEPDPRLDDEQPIEDGERLAAAQLEEDEADGDVEEEEDNEDDDDEAAPLLPVFSAAHLDALPVYEVTHSIRLLVTGRCETSLTWDQLRSPQVSQFLVKPIQQEIITSHFSRATLYALMANCLQFGKEAYTNPGNSGTSRTRGLICEVLAMKLLKDFTTIELIDALSYDFYPLQGLPHPDTGTTTPVQYRESSQKTRPQHRVARTSTLEVAIRAQAKRFLAHPSVVQHLEAIWAGTIVFHSAADSLHRLPSNIISTQHRKYTNGGLTARFSLMNAGSMEPKMTLGSFPLRRTVTLYDPRDASLFKLSRLRVPRYRQFTSTCSFAVFLCLYVAVLAQRSLDFTTLEVIFWFWSAGFMLDEIVGFNEQGFGLYLMSFWNSFDLGILLLLIIYYALRLYGILFDQDTRQDASHKAYDVLAATAVLLFPRLFSVLDHYPYFSQLLIAFRLMAIDLVAVFVLIMISCSGFFVAFTMSFGNEDYNPAGVAYSLFQLVLGFTPAAWSLWSEYNILGRALLALFLFICHFLVITILVTVLTNSFMDIARNANEEHQFLFAINAISMVKSDALFSYIAPTNIIGWLLTPLRYCLPLRSFVKLNRTFIKLTHFPVLLCIYVYERIVLRRVAFEPTELIASQGRSRHLTVAHDPTGNGIGLFPSTMRMRQKSRVGFQKDRALAEVFRRPFNDTTQARPRLARRATSKAVKTWMRDLGPDGRASPPLEQDASVLERLEAGKLVSKPRTYLRRMTNATRDFTDATRSVVSDPEDFLSYSGVGRKPRPNAGALRPSLSINEEVEQTGAEGDDELVTNDEEDVPSVGKQAPPAQEQYLAREKEKGHLHNVYRSPRKSPELSRINSASPGSAHILQAAESPSSRKPPRPMGHDERRKGSAATILCRPRQDLQDSSASPPKRLMFSKTPTGSGLHSPKSPRKRSPRRTNQAMTKPIPIIRPSAQFQSAPNLAGMDLIGPHQHHELRRQSSSLAFDLGHQVADTAVGGVASSFATQMAIATGAVRPTTGLTGEESQMISRLMLARMKTLEEGFQEILREVKHMRREDGHRVGESSRPKGKKAHRSRDSNNSYTETAVIPEVEDGEPGDAAHPKDN